MDETLQLAVDLATELVQGCTVADIMMLGPKGSTTPVSSADLARALDDAQTETGEGPCRDAASAYHLVHTDDLATDERWPEFGPRAVQLGIRSASSYQLYLNRHESDRFGALNLYGSEPGAFDPWSLELGEVLAALCSSVLASTIARDGLNAALASRDVIGQAKGILMARHHISADAAFDRIRACSQQVNRKVTDVAEHVAATGELPS